MATKCILVGLSFLLACASGQGPPGALATSVEGRAASCFSGTVATFGPAPSPSIVIRSADAHRVELEGSSVATIAQLVGATVTACGPRDAAGRLHVSLFELREVDGMPAYLGTLRQAKGTYVLDLGAGHPPVTLADVSERLRATSARTVWVAGAWKDGAFSVRSFGMLRN